MQIVPLRFCHVSTKGAFCGLKNAPKSVFGPRNPLGELTTLPRPSSLLGRGHPSPYPTPLGTDPPSALAMRPPDVQPDLRLWCRPLFPAYCYVAKNLPLLLWEPLFCGAHVLPNMLNMPKSAAGCDSVFFLSILLWSCSME